MKHKGFDNYKGYDVQNDFIQEDHHTNPRRLYSRTGADWQMRVDYHRLRNERLARVREQMELDDLGALVVFAGANIRYLTGSYQGNWKYNCLLYTSPSPRDRTRSRMPSSA